MAGRTSFPVAVLTTMALIATSVAGSAPTTAPGIAPATAPATRPIGAELASGTISLKAPDVMPAGLPVVVTLTVKNTGKTEWQLWNGSGVGGFVVVLAGDDKKEFERPGPENVGLGGGSLFGSGGQVKPGETMAIPLAVDPLPPGRYTIKRVRRDQTVYFRGDDDGRATVDWPALAADVDRVLVVKDDPALAAAWGQDVLKKFRAEDPTAHWLAFKYRVPAIVDVLNKELASNDIEVALPAIREMSGWPDHPPAVGRAIGRHVRALLAEEPVRGYMLSGLTNAAVGDGTDTSLEAMLAVLADPRFAKEPQQWFDFLDMFRQPAASEALRRYLADPRAAVRYAAAIRLARRQDPSAVPVLLAILRELEEKHNGKEVTQATGDDPLQQVLYCLTEFPRDARVIEAVHAAAKSPDEAERKAAEFPMERLKYWETH